MNIEESKDFLVSTASLKEVRVFSREVFEHEKLHDIYVKNLSYLLGF